MIKKSKITIPENGWPHPEALPELYAEDIASYRDDVLLPILLSIEKKLNDACCDNLPEPGLSNKELVRLDLLQLETAKGLFLALGAVWERQLRGYLLGFAQKLEDKKLECIANGHKRVALLREIESYTGVPVEAEGTRLAEFSLVANVCRHGIGSSLQTLYAEYRDQWWDGRNDYTEDSPKLWNMRIRAIDIKEFSEQVQRYWEHLARGQGGS